MPAREKRLAKQPVNNPIILFISRKKAMAVTAIQMTLNHQIAQGVWPKIAKANALR